MNELKPCPFCGGEARTIEPARYGKRWGVLCECGAFIGFKHTEAEAVAAWNTRKPMQNIEAYVRMAIQEAERTCKKVEVDDPLCPACGHPLAKHYNYCPNCGAKVIGG